MVTQQQSLTLFNTAWLTQRIDKPSMCQANVDNKEIWGANITPPSYTPQQRVLYHWVME
jgi:hypothetical protein